MCSPYGWAFGLKFLQTKVPFFGRFCLDMCGLSGKWRKKVKMGGFFLKLIITVGMTASFGN